METDDLKIILYNRILKKEFPTNNEIYIAYYLCKDPVVQTVIQNAIEKEVNEKNKDYPNE
jgi:hypothetical protein